MYLLVCKIMQLYLFYSFIIYNIKYYADVHILNCRHMAMFAGNNSNKQLENEHFIIKDDESR